MSLVLYGFSDNGGVGGFWCLVLGVVCVMICWVLIGWSFCYLWVYDVVLFVCGVLRCLVWVDLVCAFRQLCLCWGVGPDWGFGFRLAVVAWWLW